MAVATQEETKEKVIKIVSEQMGVEKSEITMDTSFVNDLQWSPDGKLLATGSDDNTVLL